MSCSNTAAGCCLVVIPEEQPKEEVEEEEPLAGKEDEERRIAEMGRPMLGDHVKLEVIIEESYEFKVRQGERVCGQMKGKLMSDRTLINQTEMARARALTSSLIYVLSEQRHVSVPTFVFPNVTQGTFKCL